MDSEDSDNLECDVCKNFFSEHHCPRILLCTHTFCGPCLDDLIANGRKACPICRNEFIANSAEEFILNRIVLDAVKLVSSLQSGPTNPSKRRKASLSDFTSDLRENFTLKIITDFQATKAQVLEATEALKRIKESALETNAGIEDFLRKVEEAKVSNEKILFSIDQTINELGNRLDSMASEVEKVKESDAKLESTTNFASAGGILDDSKVLFNEVNDKVKELEKLLDDNMLDNVVKDIIKVDARLRHLGEEIIENIEKDPKAIFAVKKVDGKEMFGEVKVESNNRISLSHLKERETPPDCLVIKAESLLNGQSRTTFLDMGDNEDNDLGRIVIETMEDSHYGLNHFHMCLGDLGPSFADSNFISVGSKGMAGEYVSIGNYITEAGVSSEAVLKGVDWMRESGREIYNDKTFKAGDVRGLITDYNNASKFDIITMDDDSSSNENNFGVVKEGLEDLKDAVLQYPNISNVKVVNCGCIISF